MVSTTGTVAIGLSVIGLAGATTVVLTRPTAGDVSPAIQTVDTASLAMGGRSTLASLISAKAAALASTACVAGTWTPAPGDMPVQRETEHFAYRWNAGSVTATQSDAAAKLFERLYDLDINKIGFVAPGCASKTKYKINVNFITGAGATGGLDGNGNPGMWVDPTVLTDTATVAHELTHSLQGGSGGLRDSPYVGWFWENHAEFMAAQVPELHSTFTGCSMNRVLYPHYYWGYTPNRYCDWLFLEYLKDRYGYAAINDIWSKSPKATDSAHSTTDVLSVLMKSMGWNVAQLSDFFGEWAMHNVNWDYTNPDGTDQGASYRAAFGSNDENDSYKRLRTARLDPVNLGARKFAILPSQAPQRFGYNLVKLFPDAGVRSVTVHFTGVVQTAPAVTSFPGLANEPSSVDAPSSGWRWGLVAIGADGKSRYSAVNASSDGSVTFAVRSDDKSLWLMVMGAPTANQKIFWDQAYYSIYRYPWQVQLTGVMPSGFQPNAPKPTASGHAHPNGGGWVADGATVASTAYVGPNALVLGGTVSGQARIEDHAIVASGFVTGNATVGALSLIDENSVIKDNAQIATVFEGIRASTVSGTAKNLGDANYYGYSMSKGTFYGTFDDPAQLKDPARGANRTTAVPEVTAKPVYK